MSEEPADQKPKLNLVVDFDGQQFTVKVKHNTTLKKIFEAAEKRFNKSPGTLRFTCNGETLRPESTPSESELEDEDVIHAHLGQIGGGS